MWIQIRICIFLLFASVTAASAFGVDDASRNLPLVFEENAGQSPASVRFLARTSGVNIFFTSERAALALQHNSSLVLLTFDGASGLGEVIGESPVAGVSNYLVGSDPSKWQTGVRHFARVRYRNVYPGVDVVFYGYGSLLEFDLVIQPGADLRRVALRVKGASKIKLRDGNLVLQLPDGEVQWKKPFTYQILAGEKRPIDATYHVRGDRVSFAVAPHDKNSSLIIDPVFDYATYLGGGGAEWAYSVATDNTGSIYVTGATQSANFPVSAGGKQRSFAGGLGDIFVTKLKPDSSGIQYSTYIGGAGSEGDMQGYVGGIAVDDRGNAYITGVTRSADFPVTATSFQPTFGTHDSCGSGPSGGPCGDAFILKLNSTGSALLYSSFLGGGNHDEGKALAIDLNGNAYVTGITASYDFPLTSNAFQRVLRYQDGFVSKISADGSTLLYSTLLGGSGYDLSLAIAVDPSGQVHVAGMTESLDFPLKNAFDSTLDAPWDAFVTKLNSDGSDVEFSTLLGGSGTQQVLGIALDTIGDIYLAGYTDSGNFPVMNAFQPDFGGGGGNGFVTKLSSDGASILYSTFFGGQDAVSELDTIAVSAKGEAFVAGSGGSDFPVVNSAQPYGGLSDAVFAKLTPDGSGVYYSSFFGGNGYDLVSGLSLEQNGYLVMAGQTSSRDMPTHWAAPQRNFGGVSDTFIARFSESASDTPILSAPKLITIGNVYVGQASPSKSLRISNTGTRPLNISKITKSSNLGVTSDCGVVQPEESCLLNTSITINSATPDVGTITLYDDAADSPQIFTVRGTGTYGGDLEVVSLATGTLENSSGTLTLPITAVVRNNGPYDAESVILLIGNNIGGTECNPCSIGALATGASATIRFNRAPTVFGMIPITATVAVANRTPDIYRANDSRTVAVAIPLYSASSTDMEFGTHPVNAVSASQRIFFTSLGAGPFRLSFSVSGDYSQTNNCGTGNDNGCSVDVVFEPITSGIRGGALTITEEVAGTSQSISLNGTGILAPYVSLSATSLDLGTSLIGRTSVARTVTFTNSGSTPLRIADISISGEFSQSNNCPISVAAGATCMFYIAFTPLRLGTRDGTVSIRDDAEGSPHTIHLSGTGFDVSVVATRPQRASRNLSNPRPSGTRTPATFGEVTVVEQPAPRSSVLLPFVSAYQEESVQPDENSGGQKKRCEMQFKKQQKRKSKQSLANCEIKNPAN